MARSTSRRGALVAAALVAAWVAPAAAQSDESPAPPADEPLPPPADAPPADAPAADEPAADEPPVEEPAPEEPAQILDEPLAVHGFISQGAFKSTANDVIGRSERGSLAFSEVGLNVSTRLGRRLRAGIQLFARRVGEFEDPPRIDWAFVDYRWRPSLGLRAGVIKMPHGLYNEFADVDSARLPILLPPSVYPLRNRSALISHTGVALYGTQALGGAGELEYQAWLGTLSIPDNALELTGASLESVDTRYVTGVQVFWRPVEGLRLGATYLRASIDFHLRLDAAVVEELVAAGLLPADHDGALVVAQRPAQFPVASVELVRGRWLLAAEYGRSLLRQPTSLPAVLPTLHQDSELFYGLAAYRLSERVEVGGYYSVTHADADDRRGRGPGFAEPFHAFQRDLAATVRFDVDDHWLWKAELHVIDGTAELPSPARLGSTRTWGLGLVKTTVVF